MNRALLLLTTLVLSGCGEAERPRFVPASGGSPSTIAPASDRASRRSDAVGIPRNIETH